MDVRSEPPVYSLALPPYRRAPPSLFTINGQSLLAPVVTNEQLKAHLSLLHAFKNLRTVVEDGEDTRLPQNVRLLEAVPRWAWFVGLAVERFQRWAPLAVTPLRSIEEWMQHELPPIDVLMVWHAYTLNPGWYAEDCLRLFHLDALRGMNEHLLTAIAQIGDITSHNASERHKTEWLNKTGTLYDPLEAAAHLNYIDVDCPHCFYRTSVPFISADGSGYSQLNFNLKCPTSITKEGLAVLKFARDVTIDHRDPVNREEFGCGIYLAGTLHTPTFPKNQSIARTTKDKLYCNPPANRIFARPPDATTKEEWVKAVIERTNCSMARVQDTLNATLRHNTPLVKRILSAYTDDRPFSIDLVGAVIRQCLFIDKMHGFGWTAPGYFDNSENTVALGHAIARYHAFLDLISSSVTSFFVLTLDIDLAWHTHQMMAKTYQNDCIRYCKRFVEHDDKVEENHLADSFDATCRAWQHRFHVPYMQCGCPLPGDSIGQRLSNLKYRLDGGTTAAEKILLPPDRPDSLSATHPSEHNSAVDPQHSTIANMQRRARAEKIRKRQARDKKKGKTVESAPRRAIDHDVAFLLPVPFYSHIPIGGTCVAVGGPGPGLGGWPTSCPPVSQGVPGCGSSACAASAGGTTTAGCGTTSGGGTSGAGGGCGGGGTSGGCGGGGGGTSGGCGGGGC